MSFRDDGFAAQERANSLQAELARSQRELDELRQALAGTPSRDALAARDAELAALRVKLADRDAQPDVRAVDAQQFDLRTYAFLLLMASLLLVGVLESVRR